MTVRSRQSRCSEPKIGSCRAGGHCSLEGFEERKFAQVAALCVLLWKAPRERAVFSDDIDASYIGCDRICIYAEEADSDTILISEQELAHACMHRSGTWGSGQH